MTIGPPASAYRIHPLSTDLPESLGEALENFDLDTDARDILGPEFCTLYAAVKAAELQQFQREISPWEREHLLLNV